MIVLPLSAGPGSTELLRKRLLAAGTYGGDSAKHPLDLKVGA